MIDTKKTLTGLTGAHLVTDIYLAVLPAMLPLLVLQHGYTYLMAGLLITTYNLTSSFTQPVLGWLADRRGIAVHVSYSLLLSAVFTALLGFTSDYALLLVIAAVAALGHAFFHPAALMLVSRLCTPENRGRITSYFVVGGNIGFSIGPVMAGAALAGFGLPGVALLLIPALIMVPILYRLLPANLSDLAPCARAVTAPAGTESRSRLPFAMLLAASTFRAWSIFASITFLPIYLVEKGYDIAVANTLVTGMLMAGVAGQIFGGSLSDRYGRKEIIVAALALAIPSFYLFFATSGIIQIAALLLFGFSLWSTFSIAVAISHEMMPGNVGFASGLIIGLAMGIGGIGAAVNGTIADQISLEAALGTIPLPIIAALILFFLLPYPWKGGRRLFRKADTGGPSEPSVSDTGSADR